jgi:conjugative relaxase-like TrwC/TraI family protein
VVASISARGGAAAAIAYYDHLKADNYYTSDREPPGRWMGKAAERLSLHGPVVESEFEAALAGRDPKTGRSLTRQHMQDHAAGWDMTYSAPKSVSVLWALSNEGERQAIIAAYQAAVATAVQQLERSAAFTRRGPAGKAREATAGLLVAAFDHHTSRESDPQLHTHCFVFNLAPRHDRSWGSILSRDLYQAQKATGAVYRKELAEGLERQGYVIDRQAGSFRVTTIPAEVERAFSKRRQAIEEAARAYGYSTPKGMELAALRTRRAKGEAKLESLFESWRNEAKALGYTLQRDPNQREAERAHKAEAEVQNEAGNGRQLQQPANENSAAVERTPQQQGLPQPAIESGKERRGERTQNDSGRANGQQQTRQTESRTSTASAHQLTAQTAEASAHSPASGVSSGRSPSSQAAPTTSAAPSHAVTLEAAAQLGALLGQTLVTLGYCSGGGLPVPLHERSKARAKDAQRDKHHSQQYEHE